MIRNKSIYFLRTKSTIKKFWHRFYIRNCLFVSVSLIKNTGPDKYKHSGYSTGFDSCSEFLFTDGKMELVEAHLCMLIIKEKIS